MNVNQMIGEVREAINSSWVSAGQWYVGAAPDARAELLKRHHVAEEADRWICLKPCSLAEAGQILTYFRKSWFWRANVESPNGESDSLQVYAYLRSSHTNP